jgi:MFS family permease
LFNQIKFFDKIPSNQSKRREKMEKHTAQGNFKKICIIRAIRSGMFSIPIIVLFFAENGVNLREAIILQSLFALSSIVFEIPTGLFADNFGRKLSIILGGIFSTIGFFAYSVGYDFYGFLLAEMILALGMSFVSGADSALLLDTQREVEDSGVGIALEGKSRSAGMLSEAITSLVGG